MKRTQINNTIIEMVQGDITHQDTDAIVNAANSSLLGGGGVDGAIHLAAGRELLAETRLLGGCKTGDAKITAGYKLKARYVIHAVGPIYRSRSSEVEQLLASAYHRSLEIALEHDIKSIAFPAISTGVYGYPLHEAAPVALRTVRNFVRQHDEITLVRFVLYDTSSFQAFAKELEKLAQE
jgi:O-acetyl-ADP-ribose deacetylase (regulator of RNase III)